MKIRDSLCLPTLATIATTLALVPRRRAAAAAFPGAEGFGAYATAGRAARC